jgi:hypothetical protein
MLTALSGLRHQRDITAVPAREPLASPGGPAAELAACAVAAEVVPAVETGRDSPQLTQADPQLTQAVRTGRPH